MKLDEMKIARIAFWWDIQILADFLNTKKNGTKWEPRTKKEKR